MRRVGAALLVLTVIFMTAPVAADESPEERLSRIEQEIADLNAQIARQKGERTAVQKELAAAQERLAAIRSELEAASARVAEAEARIADQEAELARIEDEVAGLELQLAETRSSILSTRDQIQERAVEMYMQGLPGLETVVLGASDVSEAALGVSYAQEVMASSAVLVNNLEGLRGLEERQRTAVLARKAEAEQILVDLEAVKASLEADRAAVELKRQEAEAEMERQQQLLDSVTSDIREIEGEITALERDSAQVKAEIAARQAAGGEAPSTLAWPVNGRVTSPFGYRTHPIFGTKKLHTGIDIGVGYGTPIKAATNGTVILAQTYGGYGRATVIDHGGGLSTLYAHQSSIIVKVGQQVELGQVIGYVGCTGYCTGPHLHFEVREDGTPVNPMKYLP